MQYVGITQLLSWYSQGQYITKITAECCYLHSDYTSKAVAIVSLLVQLAMQLSRPLLVGWFTLLAKELWKKRFSGPRLACDLFITIHTGLWCNIKTVIYSCHLLLFLALFQLVWIRDRSSAVCQQPSRPEPPAPLILLHPPELTLPPHHNQGRHALHHTKHLTLCQRLLHWRPQEITSKQWI